MRFWTPAVLVCTLSVVSAQTVTAPAVPGITIDAADLPAPLDYYCPMDKDVRSDKPGHCPKCGMAFVIGVPDQTEYPLDIRVKPAEFKVGQRVRLEIEAKDPETGKTIDKFEIMHDRRFHLFL